MAAKKRGVAPEPAPPGVKPWERQPGEPDKAWGAFLSYRDQALPRALRRVNCGGMQIHALEAQDLFHQYKWQERCEAFDRHLDGIRVGEREAILRRSLQERHAQTLDILDTLLNALQREVDKFASKAAEFETETVNPAQLQRMLDTALKWRALAQGDATERVETNVSGLWDDLDPEEAKAIKKKLGLD